MILDQRHGIYCNILYTMKSFEAEEFCGFAFLCMPVKLFYMQVQGGAIQIWI